MASPTIAVNSRFGYLTVIKFAGSIKQRRHWLCRCDCGNEITVRTADLNNGNTKSCGCYQKQRAAETQFKHGGAGTIEYRLYLSMRRRCYEQTNRSYKDYGGRGIKVCERWGSFENFLADMGPRPSPKHEIERRDNDGDYAPENCYWATRWTQAANKRNNRRFTIDGRTQHLSAWAREFGHDPDRVQGRLARGWTIERALAQPARQGNYSKPRGALT